LATATPMAALLKDKGTPEPERIIMSTADDAASSRTFDAGGWQADICVAIVRGDGFTPLMPASGRNAKNPTRADRVRQTPLSGPRRGVRTLRRSRGCTTHQIPSASED